MKQEQHFCHHCRHIHLQTFVPTAEAGVWIVRCAGCGNRAVWQFESHNGILGDEYVVLSEEHTEEYTKLKRNDDDWYLRRMAYKRGD